GFDPREHSQEIFMLYSNLKSRGNPGFTRIAQSFVEIALPQPAFVPQKSKAALQLSRFKCFQRPLLGLKIKFRCFFIYEQIWILSGLGFLSVPGARAAAGSHL